MSTENRKLGPVVRKISQVSSGSVRWPPPVRIIPARGPGLPSGRSRLVAVDASSEARRCRNTRSPKPHSWSRESRSGRIAGIVAGAKVSVSSQPKFASNGLPVVRQAPGSRFPGTHQRVDRLLPGGGSHGTLGLDGSSSTRKTRGIRGRGHPTKSRVRSPASPGCHSCWWSDPGWSML